MEIITKRNTESLNDAGFERLLEELDKTDGLGPLAKKAMKSIRETADSRRALMGKGRDFQYGTLDQIVMEHLTAEEKLRAEDGSIVDRVNEAWDTAHTSQLQEQPSVALPGRDAKPNLSLLDKGLEGAQIDELARLLTDASVHSANAGIKEPLEKMTAAVKALGKTKWIFSKADIMAAVKTSWGGRDAESQAYGQFTNQVAMLTGMARTRRGVDPLCV